jgi:hypothetical protein
VVALARRVKMMGQRDPDTIDRGSIEWVLTRYAADAISAKKFSQNDFLGSD